MAYYVWITHPFLSVSSALSGKNMRQNGYRTPDLRGAIVDEAASFSPGSCVYIVP